MSSCFIDLALFLRFDSVGTDVNNNHFGLSVVPFDCSFFFGFAVDIFRLPFFGLLLLLFLSQRRRVRQKETNNKNDMLVKILGDPPPSRSFWEF